MGCCYSDQHLPNNQGQYNNCLGGQVYNTNFKGASNFRADPYMDMVQSSRRGGYNPGEGNSGGTGAVMQSQRNPKVGERRGTGVRPEESELLTPMDIHEPIEGVLISD